MEHAKFKEEEPEMATGPITGPMTCPAGEPSSKSGDLQPDREKMEIKEEAAGDTSFASSIDAMYPDPSDSFPGGLFPGSSSFDWSSPDSSSEGRNNIGGIAGQPICEERASRPGNSRIPGKDHRRYYHNHWRLEYLMDFNPRSHSMICMVCGSSLATLKLSTIKRHIRQKHPYSLYWSPCEKEVIIGSWDAHLCVDAQTLAGSEEYMAESMNPRTGLKKKRRRLPPVTKGTWRPLLGSELSFIPSSDKSHLEQYMNESLQQWFRLEFLMDYDYEGNKLHCMMCTTTLPGLSLTDVKRHILDNHPNSLKISPTQKGVILDAWINRKVKVDDGLTPGVQVENNLTPGVQIVEDMNDDKAKEKVAKKDVIDNQVMQIIAKPRPENRMWKAKGYGDLMATDIASVQHLAEENINHHRVQLIEEEKPDSSDLESMDEEEPITGDVQLFDKEWEARVKEWKARKKHMLESLQKARELQIVMVNAKKEEINEAREGQVLEEEKNNIRERQLLEEEHTTRERQMLEEQERARKAALLKRGQQKTREAQLLEEAKKKAREAQLLEEAKRKAMEAQLLEEAKKKAREAQLLEEAKRKGIEAQLLEEAKRKAIEAQLLEEAKRKAIEAQLLEEAKKKAVEAQLQEEAKRKALEAQLLEEAKRKSIEAQLQEEAKRKAIEAQLQEEAKRKAIEAQLQEEAKRKAIEAQLQEEENRKAKELQLQEEENRKAKELQLLEEENRKAKEAQLLEEIEKKAELLEEEKRKVKEAQLLEEEKTTMEAQLLEEEKGKAKEAQLKEEENRKAKEAQLMEDEKAKTKQAQLLEEQRIKDAMRLEQDKTNAHELSREVQNMEREVLVKIEDHQYAELPKDEIEGTQTANYVQPKKPQIYQKIVDGGKTQPSEAGKHVIQVQQAPAVLGIGLPMLKMDTPTPIIITRVSVLPEHTILQPPKPKPSTSASDISKTWRVIAPKVSPADIQNPKPPAVSADPSQSPAGVDPAVWEVSVWRGNNGNAIQTNGYQTRWQSEYLMDFNGVRGSVVCMYCSSSLTVLKESSIRRHIIQKHPHTWNFTAEEKATVVHDWENKLSEIKKIGTNPNMEGIVIGVSDPTLNFVKPPDCDLVEPDEEEPSWSGVLPEGKGASWDFAFGRLQAKVKDPRKYQHDRWKLEFLMDYTPAKDGLICMVCGVILMNPKISTVKMHIQQKHPDTTYLSDQEKAVVMEEWEQKMAAGQRAAGQQHDEDEICIEINEDSTTSETNGSSVAASSFRPDLILSNFPKTPKSTPSLMPPCNSSKRNYQVRWRTEFMMDYDCRRQGLICMVCGGTLATLKVSTIKRHIVQVHPYSVDFTAEERQRILEAYSEMALHYIHSEECFKTQPQEEVKGCKRKSIAMEES